MWLNVIVYLYCVSLSPPTTVIKSACLCCVCVCVCVCVCGEVCMYVCVPVWYVWKRTLETIMVTFLLGVYYTTMCYVCTCMGCVQAFACVCVCVCVCVPPFVCLFVFVLCVPFSLPLGLGWSPVAYPVLPGAQPPPVHLQCSFLEVHVGFVFCLA